jgi:peptidyl-prolyl cis-trans isomerase SurA
VDDLPPLDPGNGPTIPSPAPAPSGGAAPAPAGSPEGPPAAAPAAPPELGPPTGDNRPTSSVPAGGAVQVADLPPLEPVPSAGPSPDSPVQRAVAASVPSDSTRRDATRRDGRIQRISLQKPAGQAQDPEIPASWRQASLIAAKIGDEIITMSDLRASLSEHCRRHRIPYNELPPAEKNTLGSMLLKRLIDESLLIQEAKRTIKNPKMYDQFTQEADRFWREDVIPQLQVEFQADGEPQLREKLKEHGRSFDTISQATKRSWMAENFLHAKLKDKIKVDLPDLLKYYEAHKHDKEFDRPAENAWREIVVEVGRYPTREDARRKIEALHQSLRQGADFAALAKAQSEGPSRSREQGGLMQTSPGSYGVPAVNEALQSLAMGQVSGVLEGPSSFHIVRVEGRRGAGPAPFEELQDQIRTALQEKKYQTERAAYIRKLWDETFVSTFFDDTDSDPRRFTN